MFRFRPYYQRGTNGTGERKSCRKSKHDAIARDKSFIDRLTRHRVICLDGRKLGTLCLNLSAHLGRDVQMLQVLSQCRLKDAGKQRTEHRHSQKSRYAGNGIIHSRRGPRSALIDGVHYVSGERSHANRHAKPEHDERRKEHRPVRSPDLGPGA